MSLKLLDGSGVAFVERCLDNGLTSLYDTIMNDLPVGVQNRLHMLFPCFASTDKSLLGTR
jgi:hypothetical protein